LVAKHGYNGTKPDRVRALAIAGALIAAELDRECLPDQEVPLCTRGLCRFDAGHDGNCEPFTPAAETGERCRAPVSIGRAPIEETCGQPLPCPVHGEECGR
jgi:hypothetical protein